MPASAEIILLTAATGAGILLGPVAMVLVPEALNYLQYLAWSIAFLLGGGFIFLGLGTLP
jgi:hypothetical protein